MLSTHHPFLLMLIYFHSIMFFRLFVGSNSFRLIVSSVVSDISIFSTPSHRLSRGFQPLTDSALGFDPSIFFLLTSFDNNVATTSLRFSVVLFIPIATTKLSQESDNECNRLMHFSSSIFLMPMDNNWLMIVLNAFRCYGSESLSSSEGINSSK